MPRRTHRSAEIHAALAKAPMSALERPLLALATAGLVVGIILAASHWSVLPARIPTHFDALGRPDGYGSKSSLLMLPAISLALFALLTVAARFPGSYNYPFALTLENAARQATLARELIGWLRAMLVWLFTLIEWQTIATATGKLAGFGPSFLLVLLALVFLPIIAYFVRAWLAR